MPAKSSSPEIPLPRGWPSQVKSAILHVISLSQFSLAYTRGWAANSRNSRIRLKAELDRAHQEIALLREELRIHKLRMAQLPPHRRPYYRPAERMAILQMKAARGWSLEQASQEFLVTADTIRSWLKRVDEQGPNALIQLREPVNRFPDFVRYIVQQLKALCPMLGKVKIAQILARAGLHLGATTVGRILKEKPIPKPRKDQKKDGKDLVVTSPYPNHLWQIDLTTVPIGPGYWTTWQPFSLPQRWPFGWWIGVIIDHHSRRIMGITLFQREPTSEAVRAFLGRVIYTAGAKPRHLVSDQGPQFSCKNFKPWCRRKGIRPRFGAIGEHGSIAVIERMILTLKQSIAWLTLVPLRRRAFLRELRYLAAWYNSHRPHMTLGGRTPDEVYHRLCPMNRQSRFEPRPNWSRRSPCAKPATLVKGKPGVRLACEITFRGKRRHLPVVTLKRAA
jgi:transposase InsO family protein